MSRVELRGSTGLAGMVAGIIEQNLERDPGRVRLLHPCVANLQALDAGVVATLRLDRGRVLVTDGVAARAHLRVRASGEGLLALAKVPLRFGFPDPLRAGGRAILRDVLRGGLRIGGLVLHPIRAARLTKLLSVA